MLLIKLSADTVCLEIRVLVCWETDTECELDKRHISKNLQAFQHVEPYPNLEIPLQLQKKPTYSHNAEILPEQDLQVSPNHSKPPPNNHQRKTPNSFQPQETKSQPASKHRTHHSALTAPEFGHLRHILLTDPSMTGILPPRCSTPNLDISSAVRGELFVQYKLGGKRELR